jgi:3-hydroxyacyl-[acyl-carrier-protein] dehydratase
MEFDDWQREYGMRFSLIDKITDLKPGVSIEAVKCLRAEEEYLKDHFPLFPVMPGVLMLEAMFEASAWLVRRTQNFAYSAVLLKEARNIRYGDFVQPGQTLTIQAEIFKQDATTTTLKTQGLLKGEVAVSGRLILEHFNLADRYPLRAASDPYSRRRSKEEFDLIYAPKNGDDASNDSAATSATIA